MATSTQPVSFDCHRCNESFERGYDRQYCSEGCFFREKGAGVLEFIKHSHRFCASCFRQIRSIQKPSSEWLDTHGSPVQVAIDSGATLTSASQELQSTLDGGVQLNSVLDYTSVNSGHRKVHTESVIGEQYPTEFTTRTPYGWACVCGNQDHRHREPAIIDADTESVVTFLYYALQQLFSEGHINQSPSRSELFEGLREHWKDWEYAIGRCLHE